jgi:hypothetical protein
MNGRPGVVVCLAVVLTGCLVPSVRVYAQQQASNSAGVSPLVRVLQEKGILTADEVAQLSQASSANDADQRLAQLLLSKGIITQADYAQMMSGSAMVNASSNNSTNVSLIPTVYRVPAPGTSTSAAATPAGGTPALPAANPVQPISLDSGQAQKQTPSPQSASVSPTTLSAANPIRPLPVGGLTKGEIPAAIKLAGIGITPYGFLKTTFIHDSSSPYGDDFPLPGFISDSGPTTSPEFHVKARSTRLGANFEWLDSDPKLVITGKFEMDFEGNFNRSDNRNLSSIRSYNPSIRLAYGRLDYHFESGNTLSLVAGQDWTPFSSSTLPNILETTGLGIAFGNLYERLPQFRVGYTQKWDSFQLMPEFAVVLPASGDVPAAADLFNQLGYGERQGPDSDRPQIQGRLVGQWQLDHAPGVAPAQLIVSFEEGRRTAIALASAITAPSTPGAPNYKEAFPRGVTVGSPTNGVDFEWQLPTRWFTVIGKIYNGSDLRFYFGGQLYSYYTNTFGLTHLQDVTSVDGASTIVLGQNSAGQLVVAPEDPVRARGGFIQLGLPLSRWFGRDPEGRNAGWSLYALYGQDKANANDVAHLAPSDCPAGAADGCGRYRSNMYIGTLNYKLNKWVSFSYEQSLYQTVGNPYVPQFPIFTGISQRTWRDLRSEGGFIFSF